MSSSAVSGGGYEVHTHETVHRAYEALRAVLGDK